MDTVDGFNLDAWKAGRRCWLASHDYAGETGAALKRASARYMTLALGMDGPGRRPCAALTGADARPKGGQKGERVGIARGQRRGIAPPDRRGECGPTTTRDL